MQKHCANVIIKSAQSNQTKGSIFIVYNTISMIIALLPLAVSVRGLIITTKEMYKMKTKKRTRHALLLAVLCGLSILSGCASKEESKTSDASSQEPGSVSEPAPSGQESENQPEAGAEDAGENIGEFSMRDMAGEAYTQEMFADYDITMVNVFTTWCTPCVNEIPDLQKLKDNMADQGFHVIGIALDCADGSGGVDEEAVEKAKVLAERTGVSYPFFIPDAGYLNGRLLGIDAVPETFFVDKEGNIVGETYIGSRSYEDWKEIAEALLKGAIE